MPSTSLSKRAISPSSHHSRPSKRGKTVSKSKSNKGKKRATSKRGHASDEDGSDPGSLGASDSESDAEHDIPLKDLKAVGRTIARCCDLFCNVNKAVHLVMLSKQEEQSGSESEGEDERQARKEALNRVNSKTLARYKKVYSTLIRDIPAIKTLIDEPSHGSTLKATLKKINEAISETRSSDSGRLREKLPTYILRNRKVDTMTPPINASTAKSELGLNHLQIAGFLCPVESVAEFIEDPEKTRKKLEDGKIDMSTLELPAFLWEENGLKYNAEDIYAGLFHGFYLERVTQHIFTGPATADGTGEPRGVRSCNAVLHGMEKVEAVHIAYIAVLARFAITSQTRWAEKDSRFNYRQFYYLIMDLIDDCTDVKWREDLLKRYNLLLFKNEEGCGADFLLAKEDSGTTKSGGLLSRMRAQAAARAANTIDIAAKAAIPTPPPTSPLLNPVFEPGQINASESGGERESSPGQPPPQKVSSTRTEPPAQPPHPSPRRPPIPTTSTDATFLEEVSDLSDLEHASEEESARKLITAAKKPSTRKGKQRAQAVPVGVGQGEEEGPSKRRNTRRKGKTRNA